MLINIYNSNNKIIIIDDDDDDDDDDDEDKNHMNTNYQWVQYKVDASHNMIQLYGVQFYIISEFICKYLRPNLAIGEISLHPNKQFLYRHIHEQYFHFVFTCSSSGW